MVMSRLGELREVRHHRLGHGAVLSKQLDAVLAHQFRVALDVTARVHRRAEILEAVDF